MDTQSKENNNTGLDVFALRKSTLEKQEQLMVAVKDIVKEISEVGSIDNKTEGDISWIEQCRGILQGLKKDYAALSEQLDKINKIIGEIDIIEKESNYIISGINDRLTEANKMLNENKEPEAPTENVVPLKGLKMYQRKAY